MYHAVRLRHVAREYVALCYHMPKKPGSPWSECNPALAPGVGGGRSKRDMERPQLYCSALRLAEEADVLEAQVMFMTWHGLRVDAVEFAARGLYTLVRARLDRPCLRRWGMMPISPRPIATASVIGGEAASSCPGVRLRTGRSSPGPRG